MMEKWGVEIEVEEVENSVRWKIDAKMTKADFNILRG